jgi:hypothetical protein
VLDLISGQDKDSEKELSLAVVKDGNYKVQMVFADKIASE